MSASGDRLPCVECGGSGKDCPWCDRHGWFPRLTEERARTMAVLLRGRRRGLRRSRPRPAPPGATWEDRVRHDRAYYVWRLARFYGGQDVRLPVMATLALTSDPERKALDRIAQAVARIEYGTSVAGVIRWANALGEDVPVPADQPATARPGGPALLGKEMPDD